MFNDNTEEYLLSDIVNEIRKDYSTTNTPKMYKSWTEELYPNKILNIKFSYPGFSAVSSANQQ